MYKTISKLVFISFVALPLSAKSMDYSHPLAPKNTTDCVDYATFVVDTVEKLIESGADRDLSRDELFSAMKLNEGKRANQKYPEFSKMVAWDSYVWYRSTKYAYDPSSTYLQILTECEFAVIDKDYEKDMEELERLMGD